MPRGQHTQRRRLTKQSADLAFAAPQVVAMRLARVALAGPSPSRRDRREFRNMGTEKVAAFSHAWVAMGLEMLRWQQSLGAEVMRGLLGTWGAWGAWAAEPTAVLRGRPGSRGQRLDEAGLRVLNAGIAPVRRRAVANARRLSRRR
jgi:hypothetical protein